MGNTKEINMHRVMTNNQVKIVQEVIEHLTEKIGRQITITDFLESCRYTAVIDLIVERINTVQEQRSQIINQQIKSRASQSQKIIVGGGNGHKS
jgi:hypothetical protein